MRITKDKLKGVAEIIVKAIEFLPQEKWKDVITEILDDKIFGLTYIAYFDGSAKPNPGTMKIGGYITTPNNNRVFHYSKEIGFGTNNEAEYASLIYLTKQLVKMQTTTVTIFGDSKLVVSQVNGEWQTKKDSMRALKETALALLNQIPNWKLEHVLRTENVKADALTK